MKKKLVAPSFIRLFLILVAAYSLTKGIERHETWRIILGSVAFVFWAIFTFVLAKKFFKNEEKTF